jgi:hypothetical protein
MKSAEKPTVKQMPKPQFNMVYWSTAAPIMMAREISISARTPLALISSFHAHGCNLYRLCSNGSIERMLSLNHGQWMRIKRQLRDADLVDYEGNYGNGWEKLIKRWEEYHHEKWSYPI